MNIGNVNRQAQPASSDASAQVRRDASDQSDAAARAASAAAASAGSTTQTQGSPSAQSKRSASEAHALEKQNEVSRESVEKLVDRISQQMRVERRSLSFTVDDQLGKTIVKVIDLETDEVIRQIPSEELLRVAAAIDALGAHNAPGTDAAAGTGLLIQEKA